MRPYTQLLIALLLFTPCNAFAQNTPETFQGVLNHTLDTNPELIASRYEVKALSERYAQALAGWRPSIFAEGLLYDTTLDNSNFNGASGATTKEMSINIEQPLFRSGRTLAETSEAQSTISAGFMSAIALEQNIIRDVVQAYLDLQRDYERLQNQQEYEGLITETMKATQMRYKLGELTKTDVEQSETRLADARAGRLLAEAALNNSKTVFEHVTGLYPSSLQLTSIEFSPLPEDIRQASEKALEDNPEINAAIFRQNAALDNIDSNIRSLFPTLFAFASYNKAYDPQPGIIEDSEAHTVGLRLTVPLYESGATRSRIRQSKYLAAQRQNDINVIKRGVKNDFILAWRRYLTASVEESLRSRQIQTAENVRKGVSESAKMGERTILDVLDTERDLINIRAAMITAKYERLLAHTDILRTMGHLSSGYFGLNTRSLNAEDEINNVKDKVLTTQAN